MKPSARAAVVLAFLSAMTVRAQSPSLPGDFPLRAFPETADIRFRYADSWLRKGPEAALALKSLELPGDSGPVLLESVPKGDVFYQLFVNGKGGTFPRYSQGSWIFKRRTKDGAWLQAKIFLKSDPGTFVRIYPSGARSSMDVIVYGSVVKQGILLPIPFSDLPAPADPRAAGIPTREGTVLTLSLKSLMAMTRDSFDWTTFDPDPEFHAPTRALVDQIRANLDSLYYADDGALDANGRNVLIATGGTPETGPGRIGLNCSGFVKWIVDSILGGIHEKPTTVAELAVSHADDHGSSFSEGFEESEDPFFGLDWSHNLAKAYHDRLYPSAKNALGDSDVRDPQFAIRAEIKDVLNTLPDYEDYPERVENQGFRVDGLKAILYMLAVTEPGNFYLGTFSKEEIVRKSDLGQITVLRKYYHIAAFFPYFLPSGEFRVTVFESCEETSLDAILSRKPREYVNLSRMPVESAFIPFGIR